MREHYDFSTMKGIKNPCADRIKSASYYGHREKRKLMRAGYIYVMSNPTMPGYLKIGMTTRCPQKRARELSQSTGVPEMFAVEHYEEVLDCETAERMVYSHLSNLRTNKGREFFLLPLSEACRVVSEIAESVGRPGVVLATLVPSTQSIEADTTESNPKEILFKELYPTEQEQVKKLPPDLQIVYREMRKRALSFGPEVEVYATGQNLVFKAANVFAEIQVRKRISSLRVLLRPEGYDIAENATAQIFGITVSRVPDTHLWTVKHKIEIDAQSPMDGIEKILRQSYDAVARR